jgi:hypothetical protein
MKWNKCQINVESMWNECGTAWNECGTSWNECSMTWNNIKKCRMNVE